MKKIILFFLVSLLLGCGSSSNETEEVISYENAIKASMTVGKLTNAITVDFQESSVGLYEYVWSVRFDANNDGVVGAGDIALEIRELKQSGDVERSVKITNLNAWLVQYNESGHSSTTGLVDIEVKGNILSFVVDRDAHEYLQNITTMTQVLVRAYRSTPSANSSDYLPALNTYTQEQDTSIITDPVEDYTGNDNVSDISRFTLEIYD